MARKVYSQNRFMEDGLKPSLHLGVQYLAVAGNIAVAGGGGSFDKVHLPDIAGNGRLCGIKALLAQVLQQSLLPADGILLDQTQDGLLPLLLALVIPSAGASHVTFSLRRVCVIVCRAVSGQWPGTGRPC